MVKLCYHLYPAPMIPLTPADTPKSLADPLEIARRQALLTAPHMRPLAAYTEGLRRQVTLGAIPDFDPCDGGANARVLFLFEKPSARAFTSGFISRNNNDATAVNTLAFMQEAGLPREATTIWNIIPGWNGTMHITAAELRAGHACLEDLIRLLPALRVAVLVGRRAAAARPTLEALGLPVLASLHPSPINRAAAHARWRQIGSDWAKVHNYLGNPALNPAGLS